MRPALLAALVAFSLGWIVAGRAIKRPRFYIAWTAHVFDVSNCISIKENPDWSVCAR